MNELEKTLSWFQQAIPNPTDEQKCIQVGCHLEEVGEMLDSLLMDDTPTTIKVYSKADLYKKCNDVHMELLLDSDKQGLLDSLADQIVTAVGVAHVMGFDILGALQEVNRSNFSKFEDGKPVFNEQGKISKGNNYTPPNLTKFIGG